MPGIAADVRLESLPAGVRALFWELDERPQRLPLGYLAAKVWQRGRLEHWRWLLEQVGVEPLRDWLRADGARQLGPRDLALAAVVLRMPVPRSRMPIAWQS